MADDATEVLTEQPDEEIERELVKSAGFDPDAKPVNTDIDETAQETPDGEAAEPAGADGAGDGVPGDGGDDGNADVQGGGGEPQQAAGDVQPATGSGGVGGDVPGGTADRAGAEHEPADAVAASAARTGPDPFLTAQQQIDQQIQTLRAQMKKGDLDPFEGQEAVNDLILQRQDVIAARTQHFQQQYEAEKAASQYWADFTDNHGVPAKQGKALWSQVQRELTARGFRSQEAHILEFEHRLSALKAQGRQAAAAPAKPPAAPVPAQPAVKPPVAKTPITPAGARVAPPAAAAATTPTRKLTDEEELVQTLRRVAPRGLKATLGR